MTYTYTDKRGTLTIKARSKDEVLRRLRISVNHHTLKRVKKIVDKTHKKMP